MRSFGVPAQLWLFPGLLVLAVWESWWVGAILILFADCYCLGLLLLFDQLSKIHPLFSDFDLLKLFCKGFSWKCILILKSFKCHPGKAHVVIKTFWLLVNGWMLRCSGAPESRMKTIQVQLQNSGWNSEEHSWALVSLHRGCTQVVCQEMGHGWFYLMIPPVRWCLPVGYQWPVFLSN